MNNPDRYDKFSSAQRQDAAKLVPYLISLMSHRKEEETILDFGCGSGFVTKNILIPALTSPCAILGGIQPAVKIFAVDISQKMVDYAVESYGDPRITYLATDILKEESLFEQRFDKIFSLHVLHFLTDQTKAFQRLFNLLNPNGEIAFNFSANAPMFSIYEEMSKMPTWKEYLKDWTNFITKSYFSLDPAKDTADLMASKGFHVQESSVQQQAMTFENLEALLDASMAVNPFLHRIPEELRGQYREDYARTFLKIEKQNQIVEDCQTGPTVCNYGLVVVRAMRPGHPQTIGS